MPKVKYDRSKGLHQVAGSGLELFNDVGTLAALGSNQSTGAAITKIVTVVSAADGSKGVVLPQPGGVGDLRVVANTAGSALKVYGNATSADKIEGTAGSTAYSHAANSTSIYIYNLCFKYFTHTGTNYIIIVIYCAI